MGMSSLEIEALLLSLKVSTVAVCLSLPFGIFVAFFLSRSKFVGKAIIDSLVHLPLIVPPVVTGYLLLILLGRNGILGSQLFQWFGISLVFNWKGAAVASAVVAFPLLVRAIRISLENVDRGLESAAYTLGAGRFRVFFKVTLPLMIPGIISGGILAFARSISEFGATITFVSYIAGQTNTIPLALYNLIQMPDGESGAMRLCVISIITAMLALVASEMCSRAYLTKMEK